jgi:hypothetical protein
MPTLSAESTKAGNPLGFALPVPGTALFLQKTAYACTCGGETNIHLFL